MCEDGAYFSKHDTNNPYVDDNYFYVIEFDPTDIFTDDYDENLYTTSVYFPADQSLTYITTLAEIMETYPTNIQVKIQYQDEVIGMRTTTVCELNKFTVRYAI